MIGRAEWRMEGEDRKKRAKWQKELKKGKREKSAVAGNQTQASQILIEDRS